MKTNNLKILVTLAIFAALTAPLQAAHHEMGGSRNFDSGGRSEVRHFQPQGWSHHDREYRGHSSAQFMVVSGYYPPPPPPPVVYWGYYPPPPPPPVCYPYPIFRPGFNIMLNF